MIRLLTLNLQHGAPGAGARGTRLEDADISRSATAWAVLATLAQEIQEIAPDVVALQEAMGARSIRSTAKEVAGVDYSTLQAVLAGDAWPDSLTVARTEQGFGVRLWHGPVALSED